MYEMFLYFWVDQHWICKVIWFEQVYLKSEISRLYEMFYDLVFFFSNKH